MYTCIFRFICHKRLTFQITKCFDGGCQILCIIIVCNQLLFKETVSKSICILTSFVFLFCLCLLCLCTRLFICALWSSAGKGLTTWLSFVVSTVSLSLSHWYPGSDVVLDCIDS